MERRFYWHAFGAVCTLTWLLSACSPSTIDITSPEAFERSLGAVKASLSPGDRTRLENAIFAVGMQYYRLWYQSDYHWHVVSDEVMVSGGPGEVVDKRVFSLSLGYAAGVNPPEYHAIPVANFFDKARVLRLNLEDPMHAVAERLMAMQKPTLEKIVEATKDHQFVELRSEGGGLHTTMYFKNESPWPIVGVTILNYHEDFHPPIKPGATGSIEVEIIHPPGRGAGGGTSIEVQFDGHGPLAPVSDVELQMVANLEGDTYKTLQEIMDWVRNIH